MVIDDLFAMSMQLGGIRSQTRVPAGIVRIDEVIGELDVIMRQIREAIADLASQSMTGNDYRS